jgi:hypothetical protein
MSITTQNRTQCSPSLKSNYRPLFPLVADVLMTVLRGSALYGIIYNTAVVITTGQFDKSAEYSLAQGRPISPTQ